MKSINIKDCISQQRKEYLIKLNYQIEINKKLLPELIDLSSNEVEKLIHTTNNKDFINRLILSNDQEHLVKLLKNQNLTKTILIKLYNIFESLDKKYMYQYYFLLNKNTPLSILKLIFNSNISMGVGTNKYLEYFICHPKTTTSFLKQIYKKYPKEFLKDLLTSKNIYL
ncbi:MAG: hypothetical protein AB7E37_06640 [Candidatus Altimarinota bacterium]|jgi:hypothetical protein|uniref:Uncharacterized protein n=1 Tax=Arcobacter defluvii TaxID=873191 RepID=A0AAE7BFU1_9BACT|nr:hypothetical protein [Arcobacter defluvii]MDY0051756.1 hypothetical protein [Aliarcobacter sp.]QKF78735.1 hypothetical protein ADFLV_2763 [Arcobacter defluvii]RXI33954.1 hypothetical protein CP964_03720 [Arcobacter defluvii]